MPYLFSPPERTQTVALRGSLQYSYQVSSTAWKDASGQWHCAETPPQETLLAAAVVMHGTPQIVSDELAAELLAANVGTCTPIEP